MKNILQLLSQIIKEDKLLDVTNYFKTELNWEKQTLDTMV